MQNAKVMNEVCMLNQCKIESLN